MQGSVTGEDSEMEEEGLVQKQLRCWVPEATAQACHWPVWTRPLTVRKARGGEGRGQGLLFSCYSFF